MNIPIERRAAERLVQGRRLNMLAEPISIVNDLQLETAYAIQASAIELWDDALAGWKIGRLPTSVSGPGMTSRFIGPIFAKTVQMLTEAELRVPLLSEGQNAIEAEFMVRLAKPLKNVEPISSEAFWLEHIAAIHIGVELAGNNLAESDRLLRFVQIAAFGNNRGLLIGSQVPAYRCRSPLQVATIINGKTLGSVAVASPWDVVISAIAEAVAEATALKVEFGAGHWIATGALTGIHPVGCNQSATVQFDGFQPIDMVMSDIRK
jgi:2-keto-4-pentenoate hydratase